MDIYLKTSPEICLQRIKKRGRKGENNITLEYLKSCHEYHEQWLKNETNLLIIEDQNCQKIKEFINNHYLSKTISIDQSASVGCF